MSNEGSTGDEFSKSQLQKWEGQLSEEERARLAIIEWKNDQKVDFKKPLKDYPQIGIGKRMILLVILLDYSLRICCALHVSCIIISDYLESLYACLELQNLLQ